MADVDQTVRAAFDQLAASAHLPSDAKRQIRARASARRRVHRVGTIAAAAVTAAAVVGALTVWQSQDASRTQQADSDLDYVQWHGLTGEEVGEAFGLVPVPMSEVNDRPECLGTGARYTRFGDGSEGFCYSLDGLGIQSPVEGKLFAWQIMGFRRGPLLIEYVELQRRRAHLVKVMSMNDKDAMAELDDVTEKAEQLAQQLGLD
jgi:hypothetical protein